MTVIQLVRAFLKLPKELLRIHADQLDWAVSPDGDLFVLTKESPWIYDGGKWRAVK